MAAHRVPSSFFTKIKRLALIYKLQQQLTEDVLQQLDSLCCTSSTVHIYRRSEIYKRKLLVENINENLADAKAHSFRSFNIHT